MNFDGADPTDGWLARNTSWYTRLFEDPVFVARVTARWDALTRTGVIDSLQRFVTSRANHPSIVRVRNFERGPILSTYVWPNRMVTGSYDGEVIALDSWLRDRTSWMCSEFGR